MNALVKMEDATRGVLTYQEALSAHVKRDISYTMTHTALVLAYIKNILLA